MVREYRALGGYQFLPSHTRGDGPLFGSNSGISLLFSPHAWGWSVGFRVQDVGQFVLPTRVGMVRRVANHQEQVGVLPTRVGMVRSAAVTVSPLESSPHTWGWSG